MRPSSHARSMLLRYLKLGPQHPPDLASRLMILRCLRFGPLPSPDLARRLKQDRINAGQWLRQLAQEGRIVEFPLKLFGKWVSLYALPEHAEMAALLCGYIPLSEATDVNREVEEGVSVPLLVPH